LRESLSFMSLATWALNSAETDDIAAAFVDRSEAKRAMPSTAKRALAERELKPEELSRSAIINPVA
jgi:hypothetical protein